MLILDVDTTTMAAEWSGISYEITIRESDPNDAMNFFEYKWVLNTRGCTEGTWLPDNIETATHLPYVYYIGNPPLVISYLNAHNGIIASDELNSNGCWFTSRTEFNYPTVNTWGIKPDDDGRVLDVVHTAPDL